MKDRTTAYAESVVNRTIDRHVGKTEILCCKRHLNDLERQDTDKFPYVWDVKKSLSMIDFAENLVLAEGESPGPFHCVGYQDFIFGSWQGWVHKGTGYRRFHTSYGQVARQNGKSIDNSVPAMYYGNFAGYEYPQIYCVATKELQARIVLREVEKFVKSDRELEGTKASPGLFTIQDYKSQILCNITNGFIKALGRDSETIDGLRPFFGSVDEYHKHKTNQMYKLMVDGAKNMTEYLISVITTAGFDLNSPCKGLYDYCKDILYGAVTDETQFVYIAEMDDGDDIWNEGNWQKPNPLWTPQRLDNLRADAVKAKKMGGQELLNFETKSLNIWVQASDTQYLDVEKWMQCGTDRTLEDMRGRECYLGLDLSEGGDLTSAVLEFPLMIDGQKKYYIHSHSFMPSARLAEHEKSDKAPYRMWVQQKLLTLTETNGGLITDYKYILTYYRELTAKYELKLLGIAYDPHNASAFLNDLQEFGCDLIDIYQSPKSLSDPTKDFRLQVDAQNIIYDKSSGLLTWSMVNAKTVTNAYGDMMVDKAKRRDRIDPVDAVIDAHKMALMAKPAPQVDVSNYLKGGKLKKWWSLS